MRVRFPPRARCLLNIMKSKIIGYWLGVQQVGFNPSGDIFVGLYKEEKKKTKHNRRTTNKR